MSSGSERDRGVITVVRNLLAGSRFFVLLAVLGSFLSAVALTVYGFIVVVVEIWDKILTFRDEEHAVSHYAVEELAVEFLSIIDIFLLSTVFYIVALGLYELFVDHHLPLPHWLQIESLDELKSRVIGVVIVLIGVNFLTDYVPNPGEISILWLGISASLVILALVAATRFMPHTDRVVSHEDPENVAALVAHMRDPEQHKAWTVPPIDHEH